MLVLWNFRGRCRWWRVTMTSDDTEAQRFCGSGTSGTSGTSVASFQLLRPRRCWLLLPRWLWPAMRARGEVWSDMERQRCMRCMFRDIHVRFMLPCFSDHCVISLLFDVFWQLVYVGLGCFDGTGVPKFRRLATTSGRSERISTSGQLPPLRSLLSLWFRRLLFANLLHLFALLQTGVTC